MHASPLDDQIYRPYHELPFEKSIENALVPTRNTSTNILLNMANII